MRCRDKEPGRHQRLARFTQRGEALMIRLDRRQFLNTTALTGVGVVMADGAWALNKLEPLEDTLAEEYPYRGW